MFPRTKIFFQDPLSFLSLPKPLNVFHVVCFCPLSPATLSFVIASKIGVQVPRSPHSTAPGCDAGAFRLFFFSPWFYFHVFLLLAQERAVVDAIYFLVEARR